MFSVRGEHSPILVVVHLYGLFVVCHHGLHIIVHHPPLSLCCHVAIVVCCHHHCAASPLPNVAEGRQWCGSGWKVLQWSWGVVAIRKKKEGNWRGLQCDLLTCTTVDSNDDMHCSCLDVIAHLEGTIGMPNCILHVLLTWQVTWHRHVIAIMVGMAGGCHGEHGMPWLCWCCY